MDVWVGVKAILMIAYNNQILCFCVCCLTQPGESVNLSFQMFSFYCAADWQSLRTIVNHQQEKLAILGKTFQAKNLSTYKDITF